LKAESLTLKTWHGSSIWNLEPEKTLRSGQTTHTLAPSIRVPQPWAFEC
jgi:hypothetical protein